MWFVQERPIFTFKKLRLLTSKNKSIGANKKILVTILVHKELKLKILSGITAIKKEGRTL